MEMKTVLIEDATRDELATFAETVLGLEVHHLTQIPKLRSMISAVNPKLTQFQAPIPEPENARAPSEDAEPYRAPVGEMEEPRYDIIIPETEASDGQTAVPVSVNGRNMFIERGVRSTIKHRYYEVLNNAVQTLYDQPEGPQGPMIPRQIHAYGFSVLSAPPQEELDAWKAYQDKLQADRVAAEAA